MTLRTLHFTLRAIAPVACGLLLTACAKQPPISDYTDAPGFGLGFVHGVTAPVAMIASFFGAEVRIYAFPNSGRWYDFGYVLGILVLCAVAAKRRREEGRGPRNDAPLLSAPKSESKRSTDRYVLTLLAVLAVIVIVIWQFWLR
jgi:hypothetical protein